MAERRSLRAPRGTRDLLPPESWTLGHVTRLAMDTFAQAGYAPVETPVFEHTEVFERGVGESTEVVSKQMYTFTDLAGRSLTLRPEGTAPVVRAVLEHGLDRGPLPVKLSYAGPMFRQERPQKGRYRQFFQVGIEAIGSDAPYIDAEVIEVGRRFLQGIGVRARVLLNSIGHIDRACRQGYLRHLSDFLLANEASLAPEDRARVRVNPLRTFDSKESQTEQAMRQAPVITEHLCTACLEHFEAVQSLLGDLGVDFEIEPRLVRGLDYYTRTAFEYVAGDLGAQNAAGGGGRYDGLAESLGSTSRLPGIGLALGVDRIILAQGERVPGPDATPVDVYVVALGEDARRAALKLVTRLRAGGTGADLDLGERAMKGQMKDAARSGARWAVILGDDEMASQTAKLKDLMSGDQETVAFDSIGARVKA